MAFTAKAKLGSVADPIAGLFKSTSTVWPILAVGGSFDHFVKVMETTNSSDTTPVYEHSNLLYARFVVEGYMVAATAIDLSKMKAPLVAGSGGPDGPTGNPTTGSTFTFTVDYGGTNMEESMTCIIEHVQINYRMTSQVVAVRISGYSTNADPAIA